MPEKALSCTHSFISHVTIHPLCKTMPLWRKVTNVAIPIITVVLVLILYIAYKTYNFLTKITTPPKPALPMPANEKLANKTLLRVRSLSLKSALDRKILGKAKTETARFNLYSDFLIGKLCKAILNDEPKTLGNKKVAQDADLLLQVRFSLGYHTLELFKIGKDTIENLVSTSQAFANYYHAFQQGAAVELSEPNICKFTSPASHTTQPETTDPLHNEARDLFNFFIGELSKLSHSEIANLLKDQKFQKSDGNSSSINLEFCETFTPDEQPSLPSLPAISKPFEPEVSSSTSTASTPQEPTTPPIQNSDNGTQPLQPVSLPEIFISSDTPSAPTPTQNSNKDAQPLLTIEELVKTLYQQINELCLCPLSTDPYFKSSNSNYRLPTVDKINAAGHWYKNMKSNFEKLLIAPRPTTTSVGIAAPSTNPWEQDLTLPSAYNLTAYAFTLANWALDDIKELQTKHNLNDEDAKILLNPKECYVVGTVMGFVSFYHTFRQAADFTPSGNALKFSTPSTTPTDYANQFYQEDKDSPHYKARLLFNHLIDRLAQMPHTEGILKHRFFKKDTAIESYNSPKLT